jgi:hypothetical protein
MRRANLLFCTYLIASSAIAQQINMPALDSTNGLVFISTPFANPAEVSGLHIAICWWPENVKRWIFGAYGS